MITDDIAGILHRAGAEHDPERRGWLLAEARALAHNRAQPGDRSELLAEIERVEAADRRGAT